MCFLSLSTQDIAQSARGAVSAVYKGTTPIVSCPSRAVWAASYQHEDSPKHKLSSGHSMFSRDQHPGQPDELSDVKAGH